MSEDGEGGLSHQGSTAGMKVATELNPRGMLDQARVPESGRHGGTDVGGKGTRIGGRRPGLGQSWLVSEQR